MPARRHRVPGAPAPSSPQERRSAARLRIHQHQQQPERFAGRDHLTAALAATDRPEPGTFKAISEALEAGSAPIVGPMHARPLVIPIHDDTGAVVGGLWGTTLFDWLHVLMLFVPEPLRRQGAGRMLMQIAEAEAIDRCCNGIIVDTFSFQPLPFYQSLGFTPYGELANFPLGHSRIYLQKPLHPHTA